MEVVCPGSPNPKWGHAKTKASPSGGAFVVSESVVQGVQWTAIIGVVRTSQVEGDAMRFHGDGDGGAFRGVRYGVPPPADNDGVRVVGVDTCGVHLWCPLSVYGLYDKHAAGLLIARPALIPAMRAARWSGASAPSGFAAVMAVFQSPV